MRAWEIQRFGVDGLELVDRKDPEPAPGGVVVRMRSASLNYRDLMMVSGVYNPKMRMPLVPLSDGVGEVVAVGSEVRSVKVGDRVAGTFFQAWTGGRMTEDGARSALGGAIDGVLAEYVALSENGVVPVPEHLTDEEAATLPCAALTAWNALVTQGRIKAGDTVLVLGTGGVSIFALQFAVMSGARVVVTSSSDEKLERARGLGAFGTVNYRTAPEWHEGVRELTSGVGVDHIVEVGGAGTFGRSLKAVRRGGSISLIGVLAGAGEVNLMSVLMNGLRVQGIFVGSREMFVDMNRAIAAHGMRPVVDRVFGFEDARAAYAHMASAAHFGKICIRF